MFCNYLFFLLIYSFYFLERILSFYLNHYLYLKLFIKLRYIISIPFLNDEQIYLGIPFIYCNFRIRFQNYIMILDVIDIIYYTSNNRSSDLMEYK